MKKAIYFLLMIVFFGIAGNHTYAQPSKAKEIVLYNWKDYTVKSVLEDFEKKFGIKVILREFETKDMMLSEVQSEPEKFDVIVATDITVTLLRECRLLAELDLAKIPNQKYLKKQFRNLSLDPENKYSMAFMGGTSGLAINTNFVPADTNSWSVLWDKKYKGKIALLDDCREAMAAILKYSNFSLNTTELKNLKVAEENAKQLCHNEVQFADTLVNLEKVKQGELWIVQTYSGDVITWAKSRKDIKYILPKEGFPIMIDNLVISVDSQHKEESHQLINFLLEPQNAAKWVTEFSYFTAVDADALIGKEILNNAIIYPAKEQLEKSEVFKEVGEGEYMKIFNSLKQEKTIIKVER